MNRNIRRYCIWYFRGTCLKILCSDILHLSWLFFVSQIDKDVVMLMDDSTLAQYIPSYGDRIALFNFCRNQAPISKRKMGLFERLKKKMKLKRKTEEESEEETSNGEKETSSNEKEKGDHDKAPKTSRAVRRSTKRSVERGWIHNDGSDIKQVRAKQGGGTRKVVMDISGGYKEILKEGKGLFFPNGTSSKGHESEFTFDVWDFKQNPFTDHHISIGAIYDTVKLAKLRFYIATQPKPHSDEDASHNSAGKYDDPILQGQDDLTEVSDSQSPSLVFSHSDEDQDQVSIPPPTTTDGSTATNHPVNTDFLVVSESSFLLTEALQEDVVLQNYVVVSDPEITFGPQPDAETDLDDTLIYDPQTPDYTAQTKRITIHHSNSFSDMIEAFSDPDILTRPLEVKRILPDNKEEVGVGLGVFRDVLSAFWMDFYDRCTLGTTMKVPFIRHDFKAVTWKAIGRIFVRGFQDCHYLPIKLAPAFVEEMLFGAVYSDLTESFLQFVSCQDREILKQALEDFSSADLGDLVETLGNYECRRKISEENLPTILTEIAHKELVQKPMFVIDCWRDIVRPRISFKMDYEQLATLYDDLKATTKKVLRLLRFPADMTAKQKEVEQHLRRYIRELEEEKLSKFLRFCTGSNLIVSDSINVEFTAMSDFTRRPVAHTCGMFLELPDSYESFPEFRTEFNEILKSNVWVMDVI